MTANILQKRAMFFLRGLIHTLPAEVLISRPAGREAFMAAQAYVFPKDGIADDHVTIDFEGVKVLAPSWADEFITGIKNNYTKNISYLNTVNPSVAQTLKTLEEVKEQA